MNEEEEERSAFEIDQTEEPEPSPANKRRLSDAVQDKIELTDEEKTNALIR